MSADSVTCAKNQIPKAEIAANFALQSDVRVSTIVLQSAWTGTQAVPYHSASHDRKSPRTRDARMETPPYTYLKFETERVVRFITLLSLGIYNDPVRIAFFYAALNRPDLSATTMNTIAEEEGMVAG
ncbi:hypothetical protein VTL71DRAFT_11204 [Oculimacula yallundae]|uniref:Uncharacterized protein n=1 Tax=Oculimacula yallundae TaxID=86028 RepID=A0ABR4CVA9_9HELO